MALKQPAIDPKLLEYLEQVFPDQVPDPQMSDREVWQTVGSVKVVRHLRPLYDKQVKRRWEQEHVPRQSTTNARNATNASAPATGACRYCAATRTNTRARHRAKSTSP